MLTRVSCCEQTTQANDSPGGNKQVLVASNKTASESLREKPQTLSATVSRHRPL